MAQAEGTTELRRREGARMAGVCVTHIISSRCMFLRQPCMMAKYACAQAAQRRAGSAHRPCQLASHRSARGTATPPVSTLSALCGPLQRNPLGRVQQLRGLARRGRAVRLTKSWSE
jgi:hypothetical protein